MRYSNRNIGNPRRVLRTNASRRRLNCAESGGHVIDRADAREAYDFACEAFGADRLNQEIVDCMDNEELAACLVWLFRQYDLIDEWYEYNGELND